MSDQDFVPEPVPQPPADRPVVPPARPAPPRPPRRGALAAIALVLALLAIAGVIGGGWYLWQLQRANHAGAAALASVQAQVRALQGSAAQLRQQRATLDKQLQAAGATSRNLDQQVQGLSQRTRNLEDAVANLSEKSLSGHDSMLLDQAEMLLRMATQRYALFHDAAGALKACALADQTLAALGDPTFAGVRQTLQDERKALAATHPASREADLDTLAQLRATLPTLPLKPLDTASATPPRGFWQRTWHALSTLVVVHHDNGTPQGIADTRIARELATLDVAQAEAARLAWDDSAYRAALQRANGALAADFDSQAAAVKQARADIARLLAAQPSGSAPELGAALKELRNLRAVHAARDQNEPKAAPAPTGSSAGPHGTST